MTAAFLPVLLVQRAVKEILGDAASAGMEAVIPPKKNRKVQREYDKYLYKLRHLVENC